MSCCKGKWTGFGICNPVHEISSKNMQNFFPWPETLYWVDTASKENLPNSPCRIHGLNIKLTALSKCFLQKVEWDTLISTTGDWCIKRINWWAEGYDTGMMCKWGWKTSHWIPQYLRKHSEKNSLLIYNTVVHSNYCDYLNVCKGGQRNEILWSCPFFNDILLTSWHTALQLQCAYSPVKFCDGELNAFSRSFSHGKKWDLESSAENTSGAEYCKLPDTLAATEEDHPGPLLVKDEVNILKWRSSSQPVDEAWHFKTGVE